MAVDFDTFVDWAESRFGDVKVAGQEVRLNSIFADSDSKHHLYCNPNGGKGRVPSGVYHCWKSEKKGTLIGLVMLVDKCDLKTALKTLGLNKNSGKPIESLDFDDNLQDENFTELLGKIDWKILSLPPNTVLINKSPENWYQKCQAYLSKRKLDTQGLYFCSGGKYFGRIIIPYYSPDNKLIYFNGRTIVDHDLRYRGPEKETGVGKEDVLYFTSYPNEGEKIYLCEGEFDAMSLAKAGLAAVACGGKNLSDKQASYLSQYKICLALDADNAGQSAIANMLSKLNAYCSINPIKRMTTVSPPIGCKDWNELLCNHNAKILRAFIDKSEKELESETPYAIR